jgi:hypothetical protein
MAAIEGNPRELIPPDKPWESRVEDEDNMKVLGWVSLLFGKCYDKDIDEMESGSSF